MQKPETGSAKSALARFSPRQFKRVTTEMYQRNLELAQVNKTLSLLRTIDQIVLGGSETLESIATKISSAIVEEYKECAVAAVYGRVGTSQKHATLLGCANSTDMVTAQGNEEVSVLLAAAHPSYVRLHHESGVLNIHTDRQRIARELHMDSPTLERLANDLYIEDFYFGPLQASAGPMGVLLVGLHKQSNENTYSLLARVTEVVSKAVENKVLQDENQRILQKLRLTNDKLKALDETKDEFITMASHQLRTPLTAVKGYLSMVLEGDAGKLNPNQQKLLEQSFVSSQRMVYLISDLLNLSRLNTGKFVIEPTVVDLSDVVQAEVDQLRETAAAREVTLSYDKPAAFPRLMLDETKIHQVVMNFMDNAIYYTPSGGKIEVQLTETPTTVEYRVVDNGIGVPKSEQHKLFTKFYRAGNARQARPDGTGLGLFMAKKVVAAQGGAIIFESEVGKGSTFGFRFSKAGHLAPENALPTTGSAAAKK